MTHSIRMVLRGAFVAGVLGALGFGAVQITATPAEAAVRACTWEFGRYCSEWCKANGYSGGGCYPLYPYQAATCICFS